MALACAGALLTAACAPTLAPAGPPHQPPRLEDTRFVMGDGAALPLIRYLPDSPARAAVVALHGFNDYANAFAPVGARLARDAIATYAYDQRGFGGAPDRGLWPGSDSLIEDADAALSLVAARHPGVPVYMLGESMGGAEILAGVARGRFRAAAGFILLAPGLRGRSTLPPGAAPILWLASRAMPWLAGRAPDFGFRPTDNPEAVRALIRDPLVVRETRIGTISGLVDLVDEAVESVSHFDAPALILMGRRDEIIPPDMMRAALARMPPAGPERRRIAVYNDGYHLLTRDRRGQVVINDIAAWILARPGAPATPLPSGADRVAP
ncbi:MAG: lysophospholipase [Alphaproteobacteria bacterium]|nr:lysophospholipase [Alphaproteobacteria bacterium]